MGRAFNLLVVVEIVGGDKAKEEKGWNNRAPINSNVAEEVRLSLRSTRRETHIITVPLTMSSLLFSFFSL